MEEKIRTLKSVGIITSSTALSFFLSVMLQMLLAYLYGTRSAMDVYFLSLSIPLFISGIITSTVAVIFIPLFKEYMVKNKSNELSLLFNSLFRYMFFILLIITGIILVYAPLIISTFGSSLSLESKALAISLLRILSFAIIPMELCGFMVVNYYARESFLKPSFIRLFSPLSIMVFTVTMHRVLGIRAVAYGFLMGSFLQFLILRYFLNKVKPVSEPGWRFPRLEIKNLWRLVPLVIGAIFTFGLISPTERFLASSCPGGSVSYLGYIERIFSIIILLPNIAIPTVLLPQLSGHYAANDIAKLRNTFSGGIRSTLFITLPLVTLLFVFREPLIYTFLERGAFSRQATIATALSLACYLGVFFESERLVILNTLYAIKDVTTPFLAGLVTYLIYFIAARILSSSYSFAGLALAHSLAYLTYIGFSLIILKSKLGGIGGKRIAASVIKIVLASAGAGLIMAGAFNLYPAYSHFFVFLKLSFSTCLGAAAYIGLCILLRLEGTTQFFQILASRKNKVDPCQ